MLYIFEPDPIESSTSGARPIAVSMVERGGGNGLKLNILLKKEKKNLTKTSKWHEQKKNYGDNSWVKKTKSLLVKDKQLFGIIKFISVCIAHKRIFTSIVDWRDTCL